MNIDLFEIMDAWARSIRPSPEEKELAKKRAEICNGCEHRVQKFNKIKIGIVCTQCGCPIEKKVYSKKQNPCPLKKWESVDIEYFNKPKTKTI